MKVMLFLAWLGFAYMLIFSTLATGLFLQAFTTEKITISVSENGMNYTIDIPQRMAILSINQYGEGELELFMFMAGWFTIGIFAYHYIHIFGKKR
jgi:hypothetical protein